MKTEEKMTENQENPGKKRIRRKKIGIFGGSFNPVHNGHIRIAQEAMKACRLSEVWFIPAGDPYMKAGTDMLAAEDRLRILEQALSGLPGFSADPIEILREGESYTVDTLEELTERHPDCRFFLIVGEDAFHQMPLWKSPERILQLAELVVAGRDTECGDVPDYDTEPLPVPEKRLHRIMTQIDISSTKIRRMIREGACIRGLVPEQAEELIIRYYSEQ